MHSRTNTQTRDCEDKRLVKVNGKPALEYDGLRTGELAWILGRRFKTVADGSPGTEILDLDDAQRYAHQAYAGLGNGVDRMQRLASTDWVESLVQTKIGDTTIDLHAIKLSSAYSKTVNSNLNMHANHLSASTAIHANDVARSMRIAAGTAGAENEPEQKQGIFVLELGPFLRGTQVGTTNQTIRKGLGTEHDVERNRGDTLAYSAVEAEIRRRNLMDWTPDGVVLSKLDSPTDEPMKSTEMDARSAQLFNVAIQGPAISTSWTSDVRDHKLECQPMDRVFICLVAELSWSTHSAMKEAVEAAQEKAYEVAKAMQLVEETRSGTDSVEALKTAVSEAQDAATDLVNASHANRQGTLRERSYARLLEAQTSVGVVEARQKIGELGKADLEQAVKMVDVRQREHDEALDGWSTGEQAAVRLKGVEVLQKSIREGSVHHVAHAKLTKFRLMRSTSAHMINYSHFKPGNSTSRCGLRLGCPAQLDPDDYTTVVGDGEYIVGAWCIGTVLDSAASRSTVGTLVRTNPTSMALNLNVNIEWWSGDKLYKHYMDDSGLTMMRNQPPTSGKKRKLADEDVNKATDEVTKETEVALSLFRREGMKGGLSALLAVIRVHENVMKKEGETANKEDAIAKKLEAELVEKNERVQSRTDVLDAADNDATPAAESALTAAQLAYTNAENAVADASSMYQNTMGRYKAAKDIVKAKKLEVKRLVSYLMKDLNELVQDARKAKQTADGMLGLASGEEAQARDNLTEVEGLAKKAKTTLNQLNQLNNMNNMDESPTKEEREEAVTMLTKITGDLKEAQKELQPLSKALIVAKEKKEAADQKFSTAQNELEQVQRDLPVWVSELPAWQSTGPPGGTFFAQEGGGGEEY